MLSGVHGVDLVDGIAEFSEIDRADVFQVGCQSNSYVYTRIQK